MASASCCCWHMPWHRQQQGADKASLSTRSCRHPFPMALSHLVYVSHQLTLFLLLLSSITNCCISPHSLPLCSLLSWGMGTTSKSSLVFSQRCTMHCMACCIEGRGMVTGLGLLLSRDEWRFTGNSM